MTTSARDPHEHYDAADVRALIEEYPLAWIVTRCGSETTTLPLIGEFGEEGQLTALVGHFARGNPIEDALLTDPRATVLFTGPQGHIPTRLALRDNWAPTWNYARVRVDAEITLTPERTGQAVDLLLQTMEGSGEDAWTVDALGDRYAGMIARIVGFRAVVTRVRGRFKLGQGEDLATLQSIIAGLPDRELARWMERFNADRLQQ